MWLGGWCLISFEFQTSSHFEQTARSLISKCSFISRTNSEKNAVIWRLFLIICVSYSVRQSFSCVILISDIYFPPFKKVEWGRVWTTHRVGCSSTNSQSTDQSVVRGQPKSHKSRADQTFFVVLFFFRFLSLSFNFSLIRAFFELSSLRRSAEKIKEIE